MTTFLTGAIALMTLQTPSMSIDSLEKAVMAAEQRIGGIAIEAKHMKFRNEHVWAVMVARPNGVLGKLKVAADDGEILAEDDRISSTEFSRKYVRWTPRTLVDAARAASERNAGEIDRIELCRKGLELVWKVEVDRGSENWGLMFDSDTLGYRGESILMD